MVMDWARAFDRFHAGDAIACPPGHIERWAQVGKQNLHRHIIDHSHPPRVRIWSRPSHLLPAALPYVRMINLAI